MKQETIYICEKCGKQYGSATKASECETNHKVPSSIKETHYIPIIDCSDGLPDKICIQFANATEWYYRK